MPGHLNGQAFSRVLVNNGEQTKSFAIMGPCSYRSHRTTYGSASKAGDAHKSRRLTTTCPAWVASGAPSTLPVASGVPFSYGSPPSRYPAITPGCNDGRSQPHLVIRNSELVTLGRPRLPNHSANPAFRHRQSLPDRLDALPATGRLKSFPLPPPEGSVCPA
jgi:hypothetical protein